ncbi:hypothetical protein E5P20_23260, partial [Escherichia coli]
ACVTGQCLQRDDLAASVATGGDAVGHRTHPQPIHAVVATRAVPGSRRPAGDQQGRHPPVRHPGRRAVRPPPHWVTGHRQCQPATDRSQQPTGDRRRRSGDQPAAGQPAADAARVLSKRRDECPGTPIPGVLLGAPVRRLSGSGAPRLPIGMLHIMHARTAIPGCRATIVQRDVPNARTRSTVG